MTLPPAMAAPLPFSPPSPPPSNPPCSSNSTIRVRGKVNAITLDSCSRTGLLFDMGASNLRLCCDGVWVRRMQLCCICLMTSGYFMFECNCVVTM